MLCVLSPKVIFWRLEFLAEDGVCITPKRSSVDNVANKSDCNLVVSHHPTYIRSEYFECISKARKAQYQKDKCGLPSKL